MKKHILLLVLFAMTISVFSQRRQKSKEKESQVYELKTSLDSLSYAIGLSIASNVSQNFDSLSTEAMSVAFSDVYDAGATAKMTPEAANEYVNQYFTQLVTAEAGENLKKSE